MLPALFDCTYAQVFVGDVEHFPSASTYHDFGPNRWCFQKGRAHDRLALLLLQVLVLVVQYLHCLDRWLPHLEEITQRGLLVLPGPRLSKEPEGDRQTWSSGLQSPDMARQCNLNCSVPHRLLDESRDLEGPNPQQDNIWASISLRWKSRDRVGETSCARSN